MASWIRGFVYNNSFTSGFTISLQRFFSNPIFKHEICFINKPNFFAHSSISGFSCFFIRKLKGADFNPITKPVKPVRMEKITSILAKKELHFHTVSPGSSADSALSRMCHENVDYLIVMDDGQYVGLLTEHDITSKAVVTNKSLAKTTVGDVMNNKLPAATTDDTVERCMQLMRQHHVRYLPVFEIHSFRGIVSTEDIIEEAVNNRMEIFDTTVRRDSRFGVLT